MSSNHSSSSPSDKNTTSINQNFNNLACTTGPGWAKVEAYTFLQHSPPDLLIQLQPSLHNQGESVDGGLSDAPR